MPALQPSLSHLVDVLPASPFAWIEGEARLDDGVAGLVTLSDELRALPLGLAFERLSGAIVLVELAGPPERALARWLGDWVRTWSDLADLLQPDEITDFPRFAVHGVGLGDPLPGFTRLSLERLAAPTATPLRAEPLPEPLPFEHLHPDLQARLAWLAAVEGPLTTDELARLSRSEHATLQREHATLERVGYLEAGRSDWSLRPDAPVPADVVAAVGESVRPVLEARYAETRSPLVAARLLQLDLRRGQSGDPALAFAVLTDLLAAGRAGQAADLAQRLLTVTPSEPRLAALAARALRESGDLARAARVLADAPASDAVRLEFGRLRLAEGDVSAALASLADAKGLDARLLEASTLLEAGRGVDANRVMATLGPLPAGTSDEQRAEADNLNGKIALHLGERQVALAAFDRLCTSPLPVMRARGFHNKALIRLAESDHRRAIDLWQRTHAIASEAGQWYGAALSLYNVGVAYEYLGNYGVALRFLRDALATFRRGGYRSELALALTAIADLYLTLGRLRGARGLLRAAAGLASAHGQQLQGLRVRLREARLDIECGDPASALQRLDAVEPFLLENGTPSDRANALLVRAEARLRQGGGAELKGALAELLARYRAVLDAEQAGLLTLVGGVLRRDAGAAEAGFQAVERTGNPWEAFRAAGSVADLYRTLSDEGRHARWREIAEDWLGRFRRRVPSEFVGAIEARPDVLRHRNLRVGCLLADPKRLEARRASLARSRYPWLVGQSPVFLDTLARVEEVARLDPSPVLLRGPEGAGKLALARALHATSPRAAGPFVVLPRGGEARVLSTALVAEADGGTLVVRDAADLSGVARDLVTRLVSGRSHDRAVGGHRGPDVRVVFSVDDGAAGASAGLHPALEAASGAIEIRVPGLADRRADVPLLIAAFLAELNAEHRTSRSLSAPVLAELAKREGAGQVRALRDEVHRAYWAGDAPAPHGGARVADGDPFPIDLHQLKTDMEVRYIREALVRTDANIAAAARLLGMKRPRLSQKIRELEIDLERLRRQP